MTGLRSGPAPEFLGVVADGVEGERQQIERHEKGGTGESLEIIKPSLAGWPGDNPDPIRRPFVQRF
jgi:hypothetical protein